MVWLVVVLSPFLVAAILLLTKIGGRYHPGGDFATIELQVRDVGRHPVLIGLFSRADWHHPGPTFFYLLAVPYRLLGSMSVSLSAGALIVNAAALAALARLAFRRGGVALAMSLLAGVSVSARSLGTDFLRSPWNPDLPVLLYGVFLLLVWSLFCGDSWALTVATAVASFLIQTHVGFVVLTLPVFALGCVVFVYENRARESWGRLIRVTLLSAAIAVVMWLPPIIDQITSSPGNLGKVVHYFRSPDGPTHTLAEGWRVVTGEFGAVPEWVSGARPLGLNGLHPFVRTAPLPVLLVPFVVAVVVARRRRQRGQLTLALTLTVVLASGVFAVMRTVGLIEAYRLRWTWVVAMLAMVFAAWVGWTAVVDRWPHLERRALLPIAIGIITVATTLSLVDVATVGTPQPTYSKPMGVIVPQVLRALPPGHGVVLLRRPRDSGYWWPALAARDGTAWHPRARRYGPGESSRKAFPCSW